MSSIYTMYNIYGTRIVRVDLSGVGRGRTVSRYRYGGGRGRVASGRPMPRDRRYGERGAGERPGASRLENGTVELETGQRPGVSSLRDQDGRERDRATSWRFFVSTTERSGER